MKPRNADTAMIMNTVIFCRRGIVDDFEVSSRFVLSDYFSADSGLADLEQADFGDACWLKRCCRHRKEITIYRQRTLFDFIVVVDVRNRIRS